MRYRVYNLMMTLTAILFSCKCFDKVHLKWARVLKSRVSFPRETGRSSRDACTHHSYVCVCVSEMDAIKIETAQIVRVHLYNTTNNNNNCILGVMRDRCTPGALKLLKDALGKHMNALLVRMFARPSSLYFHFTGRRVAVYNSCCNFYLTAHPGSWTAAVLSDRNSKLTCVLLWM